MRKIATITLAIVLVTGFAAAFDVAGPEFELVRHLRQG